MHQSTLTNESRVSVRRCINAVLSLPSSSYNSAASAFTTVIDSSVVNEVLPGYRLVITAASHGCRHAVMALACWQSPTNTFLPSSANGSSHYFCDLQCYIHLKNLFTNRPLIASYALVNETLASAGCGVPAPRECHLHACRDSVTAEAELASMSI